MFYEKGYLFCLFIRQGLDNTIQFTDHNFPVNDLVYVTIASYKHAQFLECVSDETLAEEIRYFWVVFVNSVLLENS